MPCDAAAVVGELYGPDWRRPVPQVRPLPPALSRPRPPSPLQNAYNYAKTPNVRLFRPTALPKDDFNAVPFFHRLKVLLGF